MESACDPVVFWLYMCLTIYPSLDETYRIVLLYKDIFEIFAWNLPVILLCFDYICAWLYPSLDETYHGIVLLYKDISTDAIENQHHSSLNMHVMTQYFTGGRWVSPVRFRLKMSFIQISYLQQPPDLLNWCFLPGTKACYIDNFVVMMMH